MSKGQRNQLRGPNDQAASMNFKKNWILNITSNIENN